MPATDPMAVEFGLDVPTRQASAEASQKGSVRFHPMDLRLRQMVTVFY